MVTLKGTPARLAATLAVTALAVTARWLLKPVLGTELPYVTLFAAVVLAAWHAGTGYALLASALGLVAAQRLFVANAMSDSAEVAGAAAYLVSCAVVILFGAALRRTERRALSSAEETRRQQELAQREIEVRRRAESALALQKEWLRVTLASIGDGVLATDVEGRVTLLNAVAQRLIGWSEEEARGQPLEDVFRMIDERTRQPVPDVVGEALRGGGGAGLEGHRLLVARDGSERPIDDSTAPIRDEQGRVLGVVLVFRDVGERRSVHDLRRQVLDQLARQHERLQLLNDAAGQLLGSDDPDVIARDLFLRLEKHLGLHAYVNYVMSDDGRELVLRASGGIPEGASVPRLRPGEGLSGLVAQTLRPHHAGHIQVSNDPALRSLRELGFRAAVSHPLLSEGRLIGTLAFVSRTRDQFDEEEIELLGTAAGYVAVAYQRARLVRELREADRRKDVFLATLAHELRNPLAPIRNALELLRRPGVARKIAESARAMLDRQVGQIVRLVDDLLDHSRITRGVAELRREEVELASAVGGALETVRPFLEERGHEVDLALPKEQRGQVHARERHDPDRGGGRGRVRRGERLGHRRGDRGRGPAARLRRLHAGEPGEDRRARHRPVARQGSRRDPRREGHRAQPGPRSRQHLHRAAPAAAPGASRGRARRRSRRRAAAPRRDPAPAPHPRGRRQHGLGREHGAPAERAGPRRAHRTRRPLGARTDDSLRP